MTLKPLLDSKEGFHLTAYLINRGDLIDLKSQIRTTITDATDWLSDVMTTEELRKFLEPVEALLNDARIFKQMKGNIGIFRNEESFRILNIPIDIEQTCQVATSFHIKPLLRWLQGDQEFLFLGLENQAAYLYLGNQDSFKLIDSILFTTQETETWKWLNDWILDLTKSSKPKLFMAGEPKLLKILNKNLTYVNVIKTPVSLSFRQDTSIENCKTIRKILKIDSKQTLEKALLEFRFADEDNRAKKNIFQISKAVVQGKVRKLIVTDELNIFGKIDKKSGGIAIHPVDLDHEDDCILDDLAQMVLSQGGEVIVAKRNEIPKGRPILAILEDDSQFLEKIDELQYETNYKGETL
jgi:hypothetical protein